MFFMLLEHFSSARKKLEQHFYTNITSGILILKRFLISELYINYQVYGLSFYNKSIFTNKYIILLISLLLLVNINRINTQGSRGKKNMW